MGAQIFQIKDLNTQANLSLKKSNQQPTEMEMKAFATSKKIVQH